MNSVLSILYFVAVDCFRSVILIKIPSLLSEYESIFSFLLLRLATLALM